MKKEGGHSKVENMTLLFAGLFIVTGFLLGNVQTTGKAVSDEYCKLITFKPSGEKLCYGIDPIGKTNCAWKDNICQFIPSGQSCSRDFMGYCSGPDEACVKSGSTNICI
ncbi:MAG: hypothetical protein Q8Q42_01180 [Nanoarchaeota archaeon]|nr:hypothetical protein [Nanoarchaeota archaeon]